jgi:hypothetical protein
MCDAHSRLPVYHTILAFFRRFCFPAQYLTQRLPPPHFSHLFSLDSHEYPSPHRNSTRFAENAHSRALPLNPRLGAFFGQLPANSQFNGLIWGNAGSAKSTLAFELAMELGRFGNVLYNTSELFS